MSSYITVLSSDNFRVSRIAQASRSARSVNGDWLSQWEMAIFDPPLHNRHPLTDRQKHVTDDYVGDPYSCAKFGAYQSTGGF